MRKTLLLLLLVTLGLSTAMAKGKEDAKLIPEYQIEGGGAENASTALVKVTIVSKNKDFNELDFARCAVHGVLFRGYTDVDQRSLSTRSKKPIMGSPMAEAQNADFFKSFFEGSYVGYVQVQSDTRRVVKVGKEYKTKVAVAVSVAQLRRDLEQMGILKSLKSGW